MWILLVKLMSPAPWFLEPKPGEAPRSETLMARHRDKARPGRSAAAAPSPTSQDR
ncbi:hypothetical protein [Aquisphaera insulae]|uniref:hypothetical protein n=1 Tax=Aquisphaera insulae TaxID=2712864 RepID=UPI0013EC8D55|nr:hypothetical protein [Aquisphaera insulae]